ncbi:MAG: PD-(D/E)XK nuclease family transposase [candidate division KSB1 bacterium]
MREKTMSRYIDPTTDFGFKKLFGEVANKEIIADFISVTLELEAPLLEINFSNPAQLAESERERHNVIDIFCQDEDGNHFVVEMQKSRLAYIKDRMLYYATFPLAGQAKKGRLAPTYYSAETPALARIREGVATYGEKRATTSWNYRLDAVYCIAVLDYALNGSRSAINRHSIRNDEPPHELYYDKLKFVTVELPLFDETKPEYDLSRRLNKWLFFLKYLRDFERMPALFKNDAIFEKAFGVAELANLSQADRQRHHLSLKRAWDAYAALETRFDEGFDEGKELGHDEGKIEGKLEGKIEALVLILTQRLGPIPADTEKKVRALNDPKRIGDLLMQAVTMENWEALSDNLAT